MTPQVQLQMQRFLVQRRWNQVIPPCALNVKMEDGGIRYLHPTKGWKRVSYRRLGVLP